uniref:DNA repair and recombination protein RAD54-like n=1 Tax=Cacopsylla melanoneura TaxID=428564 RepID=A0A8D9ERB0_9HEMI
MNYAYLRLDGSTNVNNRKSIVDQFNDAKSPHFVLLLSARAGGVGLNLIGASRLVLYDSDWNPATDLQAMARIWRPGQMKPVHIYRLLTAGTVEEKIFQRQISKADLTQCVIDNDIMQGNEPTSKMSLEELKDLFTFEPHTESYVHTSLQCVCSGEGEVPALQIDNEDEEEDSDEDSEESFLEILKKKDNKDKDRERERRKKNRGHMLMSWAHYQGAQLNEEVLEVSNKERERERDKERERERDFDKANSEFNEMLNKLNDTKLDDGGAPVVVNGSASLNGVGGSSNDGGVDGKKQDDSGNETGVGETDQEHDDKFYDKTKSFFDNISCEAVERSKGAFQRTDWRQERKMNSETFGVAATRRGGGGYRGRGGFYYGGGGRGYNHHRNHYNNQGRNNRGGYGPRLGGGGGNRGQQHYQDRTGTKDMSSMSNNSSTTINNTSSTSAAAVKTAAQVVASTPAPVPAEAK